MGRQRRGMVSVDPIRLIDDDEALPRAEAAGALGLDPAKPAVLLHLGAGANREVGHIIDAVMSALQAFPEVQVAIAEWANAAGALSMWPQAVVVRGFPLSQYFAAFDFSIGASGYNAFHEVDRRDCRQSSWPMRHPAWTIKPVARALRRMPAPRSNCPRIACSNCRRFARCCSARRPTATTSARLAGAFAGRMEPARRPMRWLR